MVYDDDPLPKWLVYGMFACLLYDVDGERNAAAIMATEADGELMEEDFAQGIDEMTEWLRKQRQVKRRTFYKRKAMPYYGGWPMTLH